MHRALRHGDAPRRGPPPASAEEVARLMRRVAWTAALLIAWAIGGAIASLALGRVDGLRLASVAGAFGAIGAVAYALDRRAPGRTKSGAVALAGTIALAFAVAGHVLYWRSFNLRLFLLTDPAWIRWTAFAAVLIVVPLYAGSRLRALSLAWEASGSRARGPRLTLEAIARRRHADLLSPPDWRGAWRGAIARWVEGLTLPGVALHDAALAAARPTDRLHAEGSLEELADTIRAQGPTVEKQGRALVVKLGDAPALKITQARVLLPPGPTLEVRGPVDLARRMRRLLDGGAAHALVFSWSAPARRWERRLNALTRDALVASTLEERSLVMEELDRIRRSLAERALCGEEHTLLSLKEHRARSLLAHRMLSEPPGQRLGAQALAQHGALLPDVARVMDAGGLLAVKRIVFVPHWIVPVATRWGELELVVPAPTGKPDARESAAMLSAMRRRGPSIIVDINASAQFLPSAAPTGALLRDVRAAGLAVADDVATGATPADIVFVPFLASAEGYVNGITGTLASDLGQATPVAATS